MAIKNNPRPAGDIAFVMLQLDSGAAVSGAEEALEGGGASITAGTTASSGGGPASFGPASIGSTVQAGATRPAFADSSRTV